MMEQPLFQRAVIVLTTALSLIQAAGDEKVMIVPSSGSFTCPFQYNPVDREWQQETCEAMGLNYITSNGITPKLVWNPQPPSHALLGIVTVCFMPSQLKMGCTAYTQGGTTNRSKTTPRVYSKGVYVPSRV